MRQIEGPQVGVREVIRQQTQPRQHGRPAPPLRVNVQDLDRQRVARLGAVDRDWPVQRVDAVPVKAGDHARVRIRTDLVVADIARPDHERIAGIDVEHRLIACVPPKMDLFVRQIMGARHPRNLQAR